MADDVTLYLLLLMISSPGDTDRDGIPDEVESAVLQKFRPTLLISRGECDGLPASFVPGTMHPKVAARDGTIYARVTPSSVRPGEWLEIHYYHLWGKDCGKNSHDLDAEQTAVLIERAHGEWVARYWWAAAHEATVCERSNAARASWLRAEKRGATVWVSRGKHASFLSKELCSWGCGGDSCEEVQPAPAGPIVNLGEANALTHGMQWMESPRWPLREKFGPVFTPELLERLDRAQRSQVVGRDGAMYPIQAVALAGSETADGLDTGKKHTGKALGTAKEKTDGALRKAARSVRDFLRVK